MKTKPSLLILAGGMGSRYGGFKQIDPIGPGGETIIDFSIFDALRAGFDRIVVLTQPQLEHPIREHLKKTLGNNFHLTFAFQRLEDLPEGFFVPEGRTKPWGTGHAIWAARHALTGSFGVINADDFYGAASYRVLSSYLNSCSPGEYCVVGFDLLKTLSSHGTVSRGICQLDSAGNLADITEHTVIEPDPVHGARTQGEDKQWKPLPGNSLTSMNLWGFDTTLIPQLELQFRQFLETGGQSLKSEFFIPTVIDRLIKEGKNRCRVLKTPEQWFGMTYQEDRKIAAQAIQKLIEEGVYPRSLVITR